MTQDETRNATRPLLLLATLFFMWGFLTSMNDILIPHLKDVFELSHFRAMLVQLAFFGAYFVGSVVYFLVSARIGDPVARMGYQRSAVLGLVIAGAGALLFHPASLFASYGLFLSALFVLGLGFTLLQISANPYVTVLGDESTASSRLNLCQGFNSLGTTLGPLVGGRLVFELFRPAQGASAAAHAEAVRVPYLIFAGMLFALAAFLALVRLPRILPPGMVSRGASALRRPHLLLGALTIFCYVGAEVSIGSILIDYLRLDELGGVTRERASAFVSVYWGGLMIGRFLGAVSISRLALSTKAWTMLVVPVAGFFFLCLAFSQGRGMAFDETYELMKPYGLYLALNLAAFALGASRPGRTTGVFALFAAGLLAVTILGTGSLALWAVLAVGLFNSIQWSNVFSLAIEDLGHHKSQASSLLVMAIVGGAVLPPLQGALADAAGIQLSFLVPLVAYLYIAFYGFVGHAIGRAEPGDTAPPRAPAG